MDYIVLSLKFVVFSVFKVRILQFYLVKLHLTAAQYYFPC